MPHPVMLKRNANVLSRGVVCDLQGERVVASPLYKDHYSLVTCRCLEDSGKSVHVFRTRITDGSV
jgi:nitrite reductase (NADH) large subunit